MADGGFRPALNVQFTTDTASQVIVGVAVIQSGSDGGQLRPAVAQVQARYEKTPREVLTDGGFAKKEDVAALAQAAEPCTVYAPWPEHKTKDGKILGPKPEDCARVQEWYERMQTPEGKELYKERAATAECVNALARNRGLQQFLVRGVKKIRSVVLLFVLVQNLLRGEFLLQGGWGGGSSTTAPTNSVAACDERGLPVNDPSEDVPDETRRGLAPEEASAAAAASCTVNTS